MCNCVVATSNGLATHCVVLDIHVRVALEVACTCNDCVGDDVVTDFTCWWGENLIDDVDNTVGSRDISKSYCCAVCSDSYGSICDSDCEFVTVCRYDCVCAVCESCRWNASCNNVVEENVSESCNLFVGVEGVQIDTCCSECIIARSEDCVFCVTTKCCDEICNAKGCYEGSVNCCCLRSHCNVDCWSPHVRTTNCCAGVGNLVSYSVVAPGDCLATHCVVLNIHVRVALEVACPCDDCMGDNVVTNFACWWSEDFVDDMDNAVGGYDICSGYGCVISPDCDGSGIQGDCEFIAVCSNNIVVALSEIG